MNAYRCYFLNQESHIVGVECIECHDDADARLMAAQLLSGQRYMAAEIWEEGRMVCRVERGAV